MRSVASKVARSSGGRPSSPRISPSAAMCRRSAILADLRIEITDAKPRQPVLLGKVLDDPDEQIDSAVAAGVAGRADDHRHAEASRGEQHRLEIIHLPLPRARRDIGAERHRPDVARTRVGADQIRLALAADAKAAGLDRREAEMPVWAHNPQRMVGRALPLDRGGHDLRCRAGRDHAGSGHSTFSNFCRERRSAGWGWPG